MSTRPESTEQSRCLTHWRQSLERHFSLEELRVLSADLDIQFENLDANNTRQDKARALLLQVGENRQFDRLIAVVDETRTGLIGTDALCVDEDTLYADMARFEVSTRPLHRRIMQRIGVEQRVGFGLLGLLIVAALVAGYLMIRPSPADLVTPMDGEFNVAVAEFGKLNRDGESIPSAFGESLSREVFEAVRDTAQELQDTNRFVIDTRTPAQVGRIDGATQDERDENAKKRAQDLQADLLIYGHLVQEDNKASLEPQLYISDAKFPDAEDLRGPHRFGSSIVAKGDVEHNVVTRSEMRDLTSSRTRALTDFVVGLGYYALDRFSQASEHLEHAAQDEDWDEGEGKELVYLFLGSSAAQRNDLSAAQEYYAKALEIKPKYVRALLGNAQIEFLQARDGCQPGQVDAAGLQRAVDGYEAAIEEYRNSLLNDERRIPGVPAKAAYLTGEAYFCLSKAQIEDRWDDARLQYAQAIELYGKDTGGLRNLGAAAHAGLGLLELEKPGGADKQALERALDRFQKAIDLSLHPDSQAAFHASQAHIYLLLEDCDLAKRALDEADKAYADFVSLNDDRHSERIERPDLAQFLDIERSLLVQLCPARATS